MAVPGRMLAPLLVAACAACAAAPATDPRPPVPSVPPRPPRIEEVRSWAIQLQGIDRAGAFEALLAFPGEMVVIEPMRTVRGRERFHAREAVARLHRAGKLVLAYLNVGQAESYRTYWRDDWRAPTADARGEPPFLLAPDPDGWPGNYPVAFWDPAWRAIALSMAEAARDDGFDGLYLDWVLGYEHAPVVRAAREAGVDPASAMVDLLRSMRKSARVLVVQNALDLGEAAPGFYELLDGFAQESVHFSGAATADWNDPRAGDLPGLRPIEKLGRIASRGIPVFTLDYAANPANAARAAEESRARGFRPFVSRTPLDRLP